MSRSKKGPQVAYLEDAEDDTGSSLEGVEGSRQHAYATTEEPATPTRPRPNSGKSREKRPSTKKSGSSSTNASVASSDSPRHSSSKGKSVSKSALRDAEREQKEREQRRRDRRLRDEEEERRANAAAKAAKDAKKKRPSLLKHAMTQPVVQQAAYRDPPADNPSYYGVPQPAASGAYQHNRPRPASYYGQIPVSRPPVANMNWYQTHQPHAPFPVGTFPPPPGYSSHSPAMHQPTPPSPTGAPGYFDAAYDAQSQDRLRQRLSSRPSSSMGFHGATGPGYAYDDYDDDVARRITRRPSSSKKHDEDRIKMPPPRNIPARTKSAMPAAGSLFRPPPAQPAPSRQLRAPTSNRRSVEFVEQPVYDDEDFLDHSLFHDASPQPYYDVRETAMTRPQRGFVTYEQEHYDLLPAGRPSRRMSMYGTGSLGQGGVSLGADKYSEALLYQQDVSGPGQMPLTRETLRKATRRGEGASSRSTRSSASRDESDYKRSNTTGITRSSSRANDDVTVKVSGSALVRVPGAEIECIDGGEITFSNRPTGSRSGSDRASTAYQIEDSRSRLDRKTSNRRTRAPSQSDSQSRGYARTYAPYDPTLSAGGFI